LKEKRLFSSAAVVEAAVLINIFDPALGALMAGEEVVKGDHREVGSDWVLEVANLSVVVALCN